MKTIRYLSLFLAVLAALALAGGSSAFAAAPNNSYPGGASYLDSSSHSLAAHSSAWYKFDYAGDRSSIMLTLPNGNNTGLGFDVFTPAQIGDWWDEQPIGRGTAQSINCDTGAPEDNGACQADALTWVGDFNAPGTYYVEVFNNMDNGSTFQLTALGSGVSLGAPQPSAAANPNPSSAAPSTAPAPAPAAGMNMDPGHSATIDSQSHSIGANASLWYRFTYAGDRSSIMLTLPNGAVNGLAFNVYTPAQIGDWWDEQPIGRGTAQSINCDTGAPEDNGACQSNDLSWVGDFNANGTYYVQVVNNNSHSAGFLLSLQGSGVNVMP